MSFDTQLFIGFPLTFEYEERLEKVPRELLSLFIQESPDYLRRFSNEKDVFLGKQISGVTSVDSIELIQQNIYSLLRRLIPDYPYELHPLIIMTIQQNAHDLNR